MTSFGSCVAWFDNAPGWNDEDSPAASDRFGTDAETGTCDVEFLPDSDLCLSVSALCRKKMSSMARMFSSLTVSSTCFAFGVRLLLVPRLRAFPKGPFSSGMRRLVFSWLDEQVISVVLSLVHVEAAQRLKAARTMAASRTIQFLQCDEVLRPQRVKV
jgi:hypothetical protein